MEAASARMAARDRYGAFGEAPSSPLQRFISTHDFILPHDTFINTLRNSRSL
jgi:hypothetical protein